MSNRLFMEEQKHIALYAQFIKDHPEMKAGKERKLAYLRSHKILRKDYIYKFFMEK